MRRAGKRYFGKVKGELLAASPIKGISDIVRRTRTFGMAFAVENIRLKELAVVAALNKPIFDGL
jgi:hypothetical protein